MESVIFSKIIITIKLIGILIYTFFALIFSLILMFIPSFWFTDGAAIKELKQNTGIEITKQNTSIDAFEEFLGFDPYTGIKIKFNTEKSFQNLVKQIESGAFLKINNSFCRESSFSCHIDINNTNKKNEAIKKVKLYKTKGLWFKTDYGYAFGSEIDYRANSKDEYELININNMEKCSISAYVKIKEKLLLYKNYCA